MGFTVANLRKPTVILDKASPIARLVIMGRNFNRTQRNDLFKKKRVEIVLLNKKFGSLYLLFFCWQHQNSLREENTSRIIQGKKAPGDP